MTNIHVNDASCELLQRRWDTYSKERVLMTVCIENTHKTYRSVKLTVKLTILNAILLHTSSTGVEAVDATG